MTWILILVGACITIMAEVFFIAAFLLAFILRLRSYK